MKMHLLIGLLITGIAHAGSGNGGSDSCGLGWEVSKSKSLLSTSVRGTTALFAPPTFSMTSGTSGCDKHSLAKNEMEAARFATNNLDPLKLELSQGQGEYLDSFSQALRCNASGHSKLGEILQLHYSEVIDESGVEFFKKVKLQIQRSPELKSNCLS